MKTWKLVVTLLLVYFLGVFSGVLGVRLCAKYTIKKVVEGGPESVNKMIVRRLAWDLRLTDEQEAEVAKIVREAQRDLSDVRKESKPRVERQLGAAAFKIRRLLDEEQRKKFDKRISEGREKLEQFEKSRVAEETAVLPGASP
jgi:hypothetical protein